MTAPFTTTTTTAQQSGYNLPLPATANLTAATISASLFVGAAGSAVNLQYYVTGNIGGASCTAYAGFLPVTAFTSGFAAATLNVSSLLGNPSATPPVAPATAYCDSGPNGSFDGLQITSIGVNVISATNATGATATVWLDSLTITSATPTTAPFTFDTSTTFVKAGYPTITGATAAWQATCP